MAARLCLVACVVTAVAAQYSGSGAGSGSGGALRVTGVLLKGYLEQSSSGSLSGFIPELLDALKSLAGFTYQLTPRNDAVYGSNSSGSWDGMVGQLVRNEVDIAAADFTITAARDAVIDFTTPYASDDIRYLVKKGTANLNGLKYIVRRGTSVEAFVRGSTDATVQAIWKDVQANNGLVDTVQEGIDKAAQGGFAYVTSVQGAKAIVASNGQVEFIGNSLEQSFLALGVKQGSALRDQLGIALSQLSESGQLKAMMTKWGVSN